MMAKTEDGARVPPASRSLQDALDAPETASWKPEIGDQLVGVLQRYTKRDTKFRTCLLAVVADGQGDEVAVVIGPAMLRSEFARARPKPGERLGLRRLTDHPSKKYKRYRLIVEGRDAGVPDDEIERLLVGDAKRDPDA